MIATASGCATAPSTLRVVDFRDAANVRSYVATFDEGFFTIDPRGNLDLILRHRPRSQRGDSAIAQVVHIRTVWPAVPGRTIAHETQINGTVVYAVTSGGRTSTYEGAGAVFFHTDPMTDELSGHLGRVVLLPAHLPADQSPVFERVELSGEFRAVRDARGTIQAVNDLRREFGAARRLTTHGP